MSQEDSKLHTCFVCGYRTLEDRCDWEICPICFWEDDVWVETEDESSPANGMMVAQAQANFIRFGAKSNSAIPHVRRPTAEDVKECNWKPLSKVADILRQG